MTFGPDPYLHDQHRALEDKVRAFGDRHLRAWAEDEARPEERTREVARQLGQSGVLAAAVPPPHGSMDLRSLVAVREALAYYSGLADSAFAMQGLGSQPLALAGTDVQKNRWLPEVVRGNVLCSFAVTEPEAGSDLAAVRTRALPEGALWRLEGVKTFISNAGIAGLYTVLARTGEGEGHRGLSMFLVDADAPGLAVRKLEPMAAHPLGEVRFASTPAVLIGEAGKGYGLALATLDSFRPSVGAAACGLARRALDEAVRWSMSRRQFGHALADFQGVQMALADMYAELSAARLTVRQAAWLKDTGAERIGKEGAVAKLVATETAQRVIDRAVQVHGGQGVMRGSTVERLYREVRALRIYEGTSEIQKLVIARQLLKEKR
jgi:acyl-CoA dehydrogenase